MPEDRMSHRAPWECTFAKEQRSRCLPGKKTRTTTSTFEVLSLCILQAGLELGQRAQELAALPERVPRFRNCEACACNSCCAAPQAGALRNRKKVAALVRMRRSSSAFRAEHGTFARYLRTVKSDKDACTILQERFRHVGPYTAEFYLHSVGRSVYGS